MVRAWVRLWGLILLGCCVAAVAGVIATLWVMSGFHGLGVDANTVIALLLGSVGTAALAVVLMGLVFYSDASRTDEEVRDLTTPEDERDAPGNTRSRRPPNT